MSYLTLILRIVHISAGIFWGGGSLIMHFFFGPTVQATDAVGKQFAGHMMLRTRFVNAMTAAALLTVLAGISLYLIDSGGFTSAWMKSTTGIGFAVGGAFGFVGFVSGAMFGDSNKKLALLGSQLKGAPTPDQLSQIQTTQKRIATLTPIHVVSIIIAILLMSASRYLLF